MAALYEKEEVDGEIRYTDLKSIYVPWDIR
jgi:hypothetical protein